MFVCAVSIKRISTLQTKDNERFVIYRSAIGRYYLSSEIVFTKICVDQASWYRHKNALVRHPTSA